MQARCGQWRWRPMVFVATMASIVGLGVLPAAATPTGAGSLQRPASVGPTPAGPDQAPPLLDGALRRARLTGSDPDRFDAFGYSVAVCGNTAVVGGPSDDFAGAAYVFVRTGDTWTEQARLTASDAAPLTGFGQEVAISGNVAVVGAPFAGGGFEGAAYVFLRSGSGWTEQTKLTGAGGPFTGFGTSVAVSGSTVVIGEPGAAGGPGIGPEAPAAYVFARSGTSWVPRAKLTASDARAYDRFGSAADLSGNTVLVGAPEADRVSPRDDAGAAYVFVGSGVVWTEQAKLLPADGAVNALFGQAVAVNGSTAVIGAGVDLGPPAPYSGAAYVFIRSATVWTEQATVKSNGFVDDSFGDSVDVSGVTILVGRPLTGTAYLFVRAGSTWSEVAKLGPAEPAYGDRFGRSVALDISSAALVGSPNDDTAAGIDAGSAWAYSFAT